MGEVNMMAHDFLLCASNHCQILPPMEMIYPNRNILAVISSPLMIKT